MAILPDVFSNRTYYWTPTLGFSPLATSTDFSIAPHSHLYFDKKIQCLHYLIVLFRAKPCLQSLFSITVFCFIAL